MSSAGRQAGDGDRGGREEQGAQSMEDKGRQDEQTGSRADAGQERDTRWQQGDKTERDRRRQNGAWGIRRRRTDEAAKTGVARSAGWSGST